MQSGTAPPPGSGLQTHSEMELRASQRTTASCCLLAMARTSAEKAALLAPLLLSGATNHTSYANDRAMRNHYARAFRVH